MQQLLLVLASHNLDSISKVKNSLSNLPVKQKDGYDRNKTLALQTATTYGPVPLTQCAVQCEDSSGCLEEWKWHNWVKHPVKLYIYYYCYYYYYHGGRYIELSILSC